MLLTIAGYDPSNGAGITADLQTFAAHHFFGTSAITSLTVQSTLGVFATQPIDPFLLRQTLDRLTEDLPPAGIKIGMLGSADVAETVAAFLKQILDQDGSKQQISIVLDPIVKSSSGRELASQATLRVLEKELLPLVNWITPNRSELSVLTGLPVTTLAEAETAAQALGSRYPQLSLVVTGGDHDPPTDLLRLPSGETHFFAGGHIESRSTHGTGCAFSSALLCRLAAGESPTAAVRNAKIFVSEAIRQAPAVGQGKGPMQLLWPLMK